MQKHRKKSNLKLHFVNNCLNRSNYLIHFKRAHDILSYLRIQASWWCVYQFQPSEDRKSIHFLCRKTSGTSVPFLPRHKKPEIWRAGRKKSEGGSASSLSLQREKLRGKYRKRDKKVSIRGTLNRETMVERFWVTEIINGEKKTDR